MAGGAMAVAGAIGAEELEERGVAEVFFEVGALAQIFGIDFGHRQAVAAKMPGEFEEGDVLFADSGRGCRWRSFLRRRGGRWRGPSRRVGPEGDGSALREGENAARRVV